MYHGGNLAGTLGRGSCPVGDTAGESQSHTWWQVPGTSLQFSL